eukprot:scpid105320/ scgid8315/ 
MMREITTSSLLAAATSAAETGRDSHGSRACTDRLWISNITSAMIAWAQTVENVRSQWPGHMHASPMHDTCMPIQWMILYLVQKCMHGSLVDNTCMLVQCMMYVC